MGCWRERRGGTTREKRESRRKKSETRDRKTRKRRDATLSCAVEMSLEATQHFFYGNVI